MTREDFLSFVKKNRIIVIFRGISRDLILPTVEALYEGGIRMVEVTFNQNSSERLKETPEIISLLRKNMNSDMLIGAGTVLSKDEVKASKDAGAEYLLSPSVDEMIIQETVKAGLQMVPGAMSPTEIATAYKAGASLIKFFPAKDMGLTYFNSIRAPLSHIPLLAVGGMDKDAMCSFMEAGAYGVGIGPNILDKELIEQNRFKELAELAGSYVKAAQSI